MANYRIRTIIGGASIPSVGSTRPSRFFSPDVAYFEINNEQDSSESCYYYYGGVSVGVTIGRTSGGISSWSSFASDIFMDEFGGVVSFLGAAHSADDGLGLIMVNVSGMRFMTGKAAGLTINTSGWTLGVQLSASIGLSAGSLILDTSDQTMAYFYFAEGYVRRIFTDESITVPDRVTDIMYRTIYQRGITLASTDRTRYTNSQLLRRLIVRNFYQELSWDGTRFIWNVHDDNQDSAINEMVRNTVSSLDYQATLQNRIRVWAKNHPAHLNRILVYGRYPLR